jgi:hypothetical protein
MTADADTAAVAYYAAHSRITDPGEQAALLDDLPREIPALVRVVLDLVLHPKVAHHEGLELSPERLRDQERRTVPRMLQRLVELDPRPLTAPRPPERRLVGNCRDFAVLFCAALRHQGRAARLRNGFATYFYPDFFTDHWVCECWTPAARRWVAVDPDISPDAGPPGGRFDFHPLDVPPDRFLVAGRAWQTYRRGEVDPMRFGLADAPDNGPGWIASQVVRDLAALNKVELLAWDTWALGHSAFDGLSDDDEALLDHVAGLTAEAKNEALPRIRALYQGDPRLTVPPVIKSLDAATGGPPRDVHLATVVPASGT